MATDTTLNAYLARGTAAAMAAFTPTPPTPAAGADNGYLWYQTDTGKLYAWTGAAWVQVGAGSSGVTATGTLTANRLILGNGTTDITALGSLGTTTTLLHGNAGGAPTFGAVTLTTDVTGRLPYANLVASTAASRILGRTSGSAGDWAERTVGTDLSISGTVLSTQAGLRRATKTLINAEILALPITPIQLIAAPGAGFAVVPWSGVIFAKPVTSAYTNIDAACVIGVRYASPFSQGLSYIPNDTSITFGSTTNASRLLGTTTPRRAQLIPALKTEGQDRPNFGIGAAGFCSALSPWSLSGG